MAKKLSHLSILYDLEYCIPNIYTECAHNDYPNYPIFVYWIAYYYFGKAMDLEDSV
jgi:hypothetical protein